VVRSMLAHAGRPRRVTVRTNCEAGEPRGTGGMLRSAIVGLAALRAESQASCGAMLALILSQSFGVRSLRSL
jgi:hypothetical protein